MTHARVGKWGKSLAIRVPLDVAQATGLSDGERVEIDTVDGDIVIRRTDARAVARADAEAAMEKLLAAAKNYRLDGLSIRSLRDEGRPG